MTIYIIKDGCFICGGELKGNKESKYLCKHCNVLFTEEELMKAKKQREEYKPEPIAKPKDPKMFLGSVLSMKYHRQDCPYIIKILEKNKVHISSHEEAKKMGYSPCICLKVKEEKEA